MAEREYEYDDFEYVGSYEDDEPVGSTNEQERYVLRKVPWLMRANVNNPRYYADYYEYGSRPADLKYKGSYSKPPVNGKYSFRFKANPYQHEMIKNRYGSFYVLMRKGRKKYLYRKWFRVNYNK